MVGRKKKKKVCDKDLISKLPDALISELLTHLPTKEAVKTSVLSTRWRSLWLWVPRLELISREFPDFNAFVSFGNRFFDSLNESWIRRVRLRFVEGGGHPDGNSHLSSWIDALTRRRIQHLDLHFDEFYFHNVMIPKSIYTCKTLVHLRLYGLALPKAEFVSLPCLKIMHLVCISCLSEATLEKLISASPVLEDLKFSGACETVLHVRSQNLKRIGISGFIKVVIDAPLLQCLRTRFCTYKNFKIINSGFPLKLDIDVLMSHALKSESVIADILTDIKKVRDLVISSKMCKVIRLYSKSRPLCHFLHLSRLDARFCKSDLEMLPTLLESCPELKTLILELVEGPYDKNIEPKVKFATVPRCLVSSLRFVEMKRSISGYEGEMELIRYFLKNTTILEKLKLDLYYTAFLTELVAMPRCSGACEVIVR